MEGHHITAAAAAEAAITALCDEISFPWEIIDDNDEVRQVDASETKEAIFQSASQEASRENNDIPRQIRAVVATAANAKLLADQEDSEIEPLVATMIETQL